ncbi:hypothetical protein SESBI_49114, partial [Sesbania bispinosa]
MQNYVLLAESIIETQRRERAPTTNQSLSLTLHLTETEPKRKERKWKKEAVTNNINSKSSSKGKKDDLYHVLHKVPYGDSPYVRAKHAQ